MAKFTYPGVYIREARGAPPPIQGVSASIGAFIGFTLEGPVDEPVTVTSFTDFEDQMGSFTSKSLTPTHVYNFFAEGGTTAQVVRVVGTGAANGETGTGSPIDSELLTVVPAFDGVVKSVAAEGANALAATPITPGSLAISTAAGTNSENFVDNGDGTLTGSAGGSGTIDYDTGDLALTYSAAPAAALAVTATYENASFLFEMKWPGAVASEFAVVISGDPLFEDEATSSYSRFIVEIRRTSDGNATLVEQFESLVFDDSSHPNYVASVINDQLAGSRVVTCKPQGSDINPPGLAGSAVSGEAVVALPPYNGTVRTFSYPLANGSAPGSLVLNVELTENAIQVGLGDATDSPVLSLPGAPVGIDIETMEIVVPTTSGTPVSETFTWDSGTALAGDNGGTGTVSATGTVTVAMGAAETSATGVPITASYRYSPIVINDDGGGAVAINTGSTTGPAHYQLDGNGINTISYGSSNQPAVVTLTWRNTLTPTKGPSGAPLAPIQTADYFGMAPNEELVNTMAGGKDGAPVTRAQVSAAPLVGSKRGLYALNKSNEILGVCIPDFETDVLVSGDLLAYTAGRTDRFAVVSVPKGLSVQEAISYKKTTLNKNTKTGAIYYPHVKISDPLTGRAVDVPAGGHVLGIYARTDATRNVAKAPAGTEDGVIRTAIGIERQMGDDDIGQLNPNHICCLADDPQKGRVVWGARTLEQGGEFPYIQMTRLFMFMEGSVYVAMFRYVFESNTPQLRASIISEIDNFMLGLFNSNHFAGATPADAYYVVDKTTNTDVSLGIVRIEVGAAPSRPSEFISTTFRQKQLSNA